MDCLSLNKLITWFAYSIDIIILVSTSNRIILFVCSYNLAWPFFFERSVRVCVCASVKKNANFDGFQMCEFMIPMTFFHWLSKFRKCPNSFVAIENDPVVIQWTEQNHCNFKAYLNKKFERKETRKSSNWSIGKYSFISWLERRQAIFV